MTDTSPAALADQAADAIRALNHATLAPGRDEWEYPSHAYDVIGGLDRMAGGLNQTLEQIWMLLWGLAGDGHVTTDYSTPTHDLPRVREALDAARAAADQLVVALSRAHSATSSLAYRP